MNDRIHGDYNMTSTACITRAKNAKEHDQLIEAVVLLRDLINVHERQIKLLFKLVREGDNHA